MKAFLAAVLVFGATLAVSAPIYGMLNITSAETFSRETARIDGVAPLDGRLGWDPLREPLEPR